MLNNWQKHRELFLKINFASSVDGFYNDNFWSLLINEFDVIDGEQWQIEEGKGMLYVWLMLNFNSKMLQLMQSMSWTMAFGRKNLPRSQV